MKKYLLLFLAFFLSQSMFSQTVAWFPVKDGLYTEWGENLDPYNVHHEYPRPTMVRKDWMNLNGLWKFTIKPKEASKPANYDNQILVPFPPESSLSGLKRKITPDEKIWYKRDFVIPEDWSYKYILLHIGASDWETTIYVNGEKAGTHRGGYDPITVDITFLMKEEGRQEIEIEVWDPSDQSYQPRGKQNLDPKGIWYTPTSGVWQTVWIEPVMWASIKDIQNIPNVDDSTITIIPTTFQAVAGDSIICQIGAGSRVLKSDVKPVEETFHFKLDNPQLWTPEQPFLYDIRLKLLREGNLIDSVTSYFGMRKIEVKNDKNGFKRFYLNNQPIFLLGLLDQGFWPEGLYSAPSDKALEFDILQAKEMGFNLLRKHVKVEPERWYYHCDRLGMLVWQDMPNGDEHAEWEPPSGIDFKEIDREFASESQYKIEFEAIYKANSEHPSIIAWVPFNEGWGQFKTKEIFDWVNEMDTTRLLDSPSGGNFFGVGDILDFHHYPDPILPHVDSSRVTVIGEYGGLGLPVEGHTFTDKENWGYQNLTSRSDLEKRYIEYIEKLHVLIDQGLGGAIYTQISDVESEINGLFTYDRIELKPNPKKLEKAHKNLFKHFDETVE